MYQKNKDLLQNMIASKDVDIILNSSLKNIKHTHVEIDIKGKVAKKDFDKIFILIGFEPSLSFMEKINIKLEKSYGLKDIFGFLIIGFIALWVYTYNKGVTEISNLFNSSLVGEIINLNNISNPFNIWSIVLFLILIVNIIYIVYAGIKSIKKIGQKNYTILIGLIIIIWIFSGVTFIYNYLRTGILFNTGGAFWPYYTLLYSLIVTSFGFMSLLKYKKKYIWDRTLALIYSQTILLFLLPVFIFKDWRVFSLVYVWPLGPDALTNTYVVEGSILGFLSNGFFMWLGIILSFVGFSILVYYKGRGAVCSWFCGCGALAETLGDPFRKKTPQGKSAKWLEYSSYFLFGFAAIVTILKAFRNTMLPVVFAISFFTLFFMWFSYRKIKNNIIPISIFIGLIFGYVLDIIIIKYGGSSFTLYKYFADFTLAGWVAVAAYFFIGGRIWCRYFCPLISYLGIISSIGRFKIRPNPDKCISCGLCTRNCHMGIDVMNYAQKGHDMKEPSCVGCGICVEVCPMDLFNVVTDNKTIGPGTSYQIKENPNKLKIIDFQKSSFEKNNISNSSKLNKFQVLAMGGKPEATKTLMAARAKMIKGMKSKTLKVLK